MLEIFLYENAFDSISHGLEHLKLAKKEGNKEDFKHAILAIFQGSELLLKQLLCLINPILMFDKNSLYEKCKDPTKPMLEELFDCKSLEINKLSSEVIKYYPGLNSSSLKVINKVAKVRNKIQHFGIQIEEKEFIDSILELYHHVITPSFKIIGGVVKDVRPFNDYFNGELDRIFSFSSIADKEEELIRINNEDYHRTICHHCGNFSLFVFYDDSSFPVRYSCSSCNNQKQDIDMQQYLICPECGAPSLLYDEDLEAGICLWYKCANNRDGGVSVEMEYCPVCCEYKIEQKCKCSTDELIG